LRPSVRWYLDKAAKKLIGCLGKKTPLAFAEVSALTPLRPCRAPEAMGVNERQRMHNCLKLRLKLSQIKRRGRPRGALSGQLLLQKRPALAWGRSTTER